MIGYALSQLRSQNRHHEFEHLCRELARARLVSNILPATGPVAGSGDQGRDIETFHTYLAGSLRFSTGFIGLAAPDTVVFACTLQHEGVSAKIKADVASICTQGTPVQRIYFFCAEPVKVAERHDLTAWATAEYRVALEVFDRQAIAELLSDHEVFWIARTYLHLPAELAPARPPDEPDLPAWYSSLKQDWSRADRSIGNIGEMMQAVEGLRHATDTRASRADLGEWLHLVEAFLSTVTDLGTAQRARYEISRSTLRGTGDLRPAEHHTRGYFADARSMEEPSDLLDATVLLQYTEAASRNGEASLSCAEIQGWAAELRDHIASLLETAAMPGRRAGLLNAAAHLSLRFDVEALAQLAPPRTPSPEPRPHMAPDDLADIEIPHWIPLVDLDHGMRALLELVELLPHAPLFPIGSLARHFDLLTPALVEHSLYPQVRSGLDEATDRQAGEAATAQRCRTRATGLYNSGKRLAALRELHQAKVHWWHGDTVRQSILAMLFIAHIYSGLLLPQAAKKYALAAGYAALNANDQRVHDLAPVALFRAAQYDHQCGAWVSALKLTRVAILLQDRLAADPWNLDRHEDLAVTIIHTATIKAVSRHRPALAEPIDQLISDAALTDEVNEVLALDRSFLDWDEAALRLHSEKELTGSPFADTAQIRVFSFGELGQRWRVQCRNERAAVTATEEFCAAVQLVLAEFAGDDPVLLRSTIQIEIDLFDITNQPADRVVPLPDNTLSRWKVYLPAQAGEDARDFDVELLTTLALILHGGSLLPWDRFLAVLDSAGHGGLMSKLTAVTDYRKTAEYFTGEQSALTGEVRAEPFGDPAEFPIREAPELVAPTKAGPGYSREKALEAIEARYANCAAVTRHTLPRVLADPTLQALCARLVAEGRPEWIVLMALANVVVNFRVRRLHGPPGRMPDARWPQRAGEEMRREERPDDPTPSIAEITETFAMQVNIVAATIARFWGLELNRDTPEFGAVEAVLKDRYRYWDDDVEHASFFVG